ncbi:hypothetical protein KA977_14220 [Candidatus Dependentiae bacterium]|nr:hypothetical protein [Candidatus Dependentiae bacterium]
MPFFAHPDILWINAGPSQLSNNVWNIYEYHGEQRNIHLFKYPPLAYFVLGINFFVVKPLLHKTDYFDNISDIHSYNEWFEYSGIFQSLFFLKVIFLLADAGTAILLCNIFKEKSKQIVKYWALSPFAVYAIFMYGQFDIIPVAMIIVSLYFFKIEKYEYSFLFLGIGGMLKHFPFMILPVLFISVPVKFWKKCIFALIAILPYIILSIAYLNTKSFIDDVILNSAGYLSSMKIFAGGYGIILILNFVLTFFFNFDRFYAFIKFGYLTLIWYLICSEFHPQFIIWVIPFIYFLINSKNRKYYYLLILMYFVYINNWGRNSTWILFMPLDLELTLLPSINSAISNYFNYEIIVKISKYCMNCLLIIFLFSNLRSFNKKKAYV